jgi:drug/metabolite transporter (DMT)-like permease
MNETNIIVGIFGAMSAVGPALVAVYLLFLKEIDSVSRWGLGLMLVLSAVMAVMSWPVALQNSSQAAWIIGAGICAAWFLLPLSFLTVKDTRR